MVCVIIRRLPLRKLNGKTYKPQGLIVPNAHHIRSLQESDLKKMDSSAQIFNFLSDIPSKVDDIDELIAASYEVAQSLNHGLIESHRRKHLAYLMADQGAILNPEQTKNLPKQVDGL